MEAKLLEGLSRFASRRGFLQSAAMVCQAFGLSLLGVKVVHGTGCGCPPCFPLACCDMCCPPSTCTNCACVWSWPCSHTDGCTYSCLECYSAGPCSADGCPPTTICSQVTLIKKAVNETCQEDWCCDSNRCCGGICRAADVCQQPLWPCTTDCDCCSKMCDTQMGACS